MSNIPKARTLWPLPGGAGTYLSTMRGMLEMVSRTTDRAVVVTQIMAEHDLTSFKSARSYLQVLHTLGLIETVGLSVYLTELGRQELEAPDTARVRQALLQRVAGCSELLNALGRRPLRMSAACEAMRVQGFNWTTQTQVRYRLRWLEEIGDVERRGSARPEYRLAVGTTVRS